MSMLRITQSGEAEFITKGKGRPHVFQIEDTAEGTGSVLLKYRQVRNPDPDPDTNLHKALPLI